MGNSDVEPPNLTTSGPKRSRTKRLAPYLLVSGLLISVGVFVLNFAWKTVAGEPEWRLFVETRSRGGPVYEERLLVSSHPYITGSMNGWTNLTDTKPEFVMAAYYRVYTGSGCRFGLSSHARAGEVDIDRLEDVLDTHLGSWVPPAGWERYNSTRHYRATAPGGGMPAASVHVTASLHPVYSRYKPLVRFWRRGNMHPPLRELDVVTVAEYAGADAPPPSLVAVQRAEEAIGWLGEFGFLWASEEGPGLEEMVLLWPIGGVEASGEEVEAMDAQCRSGLAERLAGAPIYQLLSRGT